MAGVAYLKRCWIYTDTDPGMLVTLSADYGLLLVWHMAVEATAHSKMGYIREADIC